MDREIKLRTVNIIENFVENNFAGCINRQPS